MTGKGLFAPLTIGDVEIDNRIAMAPMNMTYSTQDGYVTPQDDEAACRPVPKIYGESRGRL